MAMMIVAATMESGTAAYTAALIGASLFDSRLTFPTLFPPPTQYGPKLDTLDLNVGSEGSGGTIAFGPECYVTPTVIWLTKLYDHENHSSTGKGAGASGDYITTTYYCHLALSVCLNPTQELVKLWADGKLLYEKKDDISLSTSAVSGTAHTNVRWDPISHTYKDDCQTLHVQNDDGSVDLSQFQSGRKITFAGGASGNNRQCTCISSGRIGSTNSTWVELGDDILTSTFTTAFTSFSVGTACTLFQDNPSWSKKRVNDIRVHVGEQDQEPDPLMENIEGVGKVSAHRGETTVVLEKLWLTDYGNRPPTFTALVKERDSITIGEIIEAITVMTGMSPSQVDASACTAVCRGYPVKTPVMASQALQPLMIAYDLTRTEIDGVLVYRPRSSLESSTVEPGVEFGSDSPVPHEVTDSTEQTPSELHLRFIDPDKDYDTGDAPSFYPLARNDEVREIDLPVCLSRADAFVVSNRLLFNAVGARRLRAVLPPRFVEVAMEGQLIDWVDADGDQWTMLIEEVERDVTDVLQVSGYEFLPFLSSGLTVQTTQTSSFSPLRSSFDPPAIRGRVLDVPALHDSHNAGPGLYFVAYPPRGQLFTMTTVYETKDDPTAETPALWSPVAVIQVGAIFGRATSVLGTSTPNAYDTTNTVDVELIDGELSSVTYERMTRGSNRVMVGGELLGFEVATATGDQTYTLSNLLRGLRGTDPTVTHQVDEDFLVLSREALVFYPLNAGAVGQTRYYKFVPVGAAIEDCPYIEVVVGGINSRPLAPATAVGWRDASNNVSVSWSRVSRAIGLDATTTAGPVVDPNVWYEVEVGPDGSTVYRTIRTRFTRCRYSAAQQVIDGFTPGDTVYFSVRQANDRVGLGEATTGNV